MSQSVPNCGLPLVTADYQVGPQGQMMFGRLEFDFRERPTGPIVGDIPVPEVSTTQRPGSGSPGIPGDDSTSPSARKLHPPGSTASIFDKQPDERR